MFFVSEYLNKIKTGHRPYLEMDQFNLIPKEEISVSSIQIRPGNIIVLVRDYTHLEHLRKTIQELDTKKKDLVVLTLRVLSGPDTGYQNLREQNLFTDYEQHLFSKVTKLAEKEGKHVELLVIPSSRVFDAIAITAARLQSSEIVAGRSSVMSPEQQARSLGQSWDKVILTEKPKYRILFRVIGNDGRVWVFPLGPHLPVLTGRDIELIHKLWLDLSREPGFENLHHVDIVTYALTQFQAELQGPSRENFIRRLSRR